MAGLLEAILTRRYGAPTSAVRHGHAARIWNPNSVYQESTLYLGMNWDAQGTRVYGSYKNLYDDAIGALLVGGSLKVATLTGVGIWGVYKLEELQDQAEVHRALRIDSDLLFFMDASNVWYYAIKGDWMFAFDSELDEVESLGPMEKAFENLLRQWEEAGASLPEKA